MTSTPSPHTHTHTHTGLLQHVWDPLSTSQTQRVVALIRRLAEDYPTISADNKETQVIESGDRRLNVYSKLM